jgi:hypothetical protein
MSQRQPRERRKTGEVVAHDLMEALIPFQEEVSGRLNEHNFAADAFAAGEHNAGMALAVGLLSEAVNPTENGAVESEWEDGGTFTNRQIDNNSAWTRIPVSATAFMEKSVTTKGGMLWITASFQATYIDESTADYSISPARLPDPVLNHLGNSLAGTMWAIRVDGVVTEPGNCGEDIPFEGTLGYRLVNQAIVIEALTPADPGTHLVEVVALATSSRAHDQLVVEVYSHDLIVREIRG